MRTETAIGAGVVLVMGLLSLGGTVSSLKWLRARWQRRPQDIGPIRFEAPMGMVTIVPVEER